MIGANVKQRFLQFQKKTNADFIFQGAGVQHVGIL